LEIKPQPEEKEEKLIKEDSIESEKEKIVKEELI
jgi:hypothetical protein